MGSPKRFRLDVLLAGPQPTPDPAFRHPDETDTEALGELMWDAYRGTPDEADAGDGVATATHEIQVLFNGEHGPFLPAASYLAEGAGAALVTEWKGVPLLAYVFTAPTHTSQGIARSLIKASMWALTEMGYERLSLAVTKRNTRAHHLYTSLGFHPHH